MKYVKYIDFSVQTIILIVAIVMLLITIRNNWVSSVLSAQFFLGTWQMLSSAISLCREGAAFKQKRTHFILAAFYLFLLIAPSWVGAGGLPFSNGQALFFLIGPPWLLGIYYYLITWQVTFPRYKRNSNFLPHINF